MADTTIDKLALDISVKENDSANKINSVASAIDNLQTALGGLSGVQSQMEKISSMFSSFSTSGTTIQAPQLQIETAELNDDLANNLDSISLKGSEANKKLDELNEAFSQQIQVVTEDEYAIERLKIAIGKLDGTYGLSGESAREAAKAFGYVDEEVNNSGDSATKAQTKWNKFINSIKRIALYRAIRAAIKEIAQALQEGFNNFVQFDSGSNKAMSNVKNSVDQLKNTLGVTMGYLVQSLEPILVGLSDMAVSLFDNINMAMASLQGKDTYAKAIKQNKDYAESLKKVNGQLLKFDTFNTLPQSQEQTNPADLYEEVEMPEDLPAIAETFQTIFNVISDIIDIVKDLIDAIAPLVEPVFQIVSAVLEVVKVLLKILMPVIKNIIKYWGALYQQIAGAFLGISGLLKLLTGDFDGAWKDIANGFAAMCNGIVNMFVQLGAFIVRILKVILVDTNPLFWILKALGVVDVGKLADNWIDSWSSWKLDWKPYATGGSFNTGDYFVANENGATELIASSNNGGAVMNMEQLQSAIYSGMMMAMADSGGKEISLRVDQNILGRVVAQSAGFINETNRRNQNLKLI